MKERLRVKVIGKFFNWLFESERRGEMSEDVELQTDAAKKACREVVVDILIEVYSDRIAELTRKIERLREEKSVLEKEAAE